MSEIRKIAEQTVGDPEQFVMRVAELARTPTPRLVAVRYHGPWGQDILEKARLELLMDSTPGPYGLRSISPKGEVRRFSVPAAPEAMELWLRRFFACEVSNLSGATSPDSTLPKQLPVEPHRPRKASSKQLSLF